MLDTTSDPAQDIKQVQDFYTNRMIGLGVLLVGAGALAGLGYQWGWWSMLVSAGSALLLLLRGYLDARRLWLGAIADAKTVRHVLRANLETPAAQEPLKPLVLDPEGFLNGR